MPLSSCWLWTINSSSWASCSEALWRECSTSLTRRFSHSRTVGGISGCSARSRKASKGTSPGIPSIAMSRSEKVAASASRRDSWAASPNDINCAGGSIKISTGRRYLSITAFQAVTCCKICSAQ